MPLDVYAPSLAESFTSGGTGRIPFGSGVGLADSSALAWDDTLKKLSLTGSVTKVSAAGTTWSSLSIPASTLTLTGGVAITGVVALATVASPTITSASATTVADAFTLDIGAPPVAAGSVTLTRTRALRVGGSGYVATFGDGSGDLQLEGHTTFGRQEFLRLTNTGAGNAVGLCNNKLSIATDGSVTFADAANIVVNATTGTKIGTATTQKLGFWNHAPAVQQASAADLTNNVTSGGSNDVIADFTSLTVYATDAAAIRNDIYQLARKLKQVNDGLRAVGILS